MGIFGGGDSARLTEYRIGQVEASIKEIMANQLRITERIVRLESESETASLSKRVDQIGEQIAGLSSVVYELKGAMEESGNQWIADTAKGITIINEGNKNVENKAPVAQQNIGQAGGNAHV